MHGALPSLKDVVYRNRVAIGVAEVVDFRRPRLTVIAPSTPREGAAGQAIQKHEVMLGLPKQRVWRAERARRQDRRERAAPARMGGACAAG